MLDSCIPISVSLGDVAVRVLPKPKELLSALISTRLSVAIAPLLPGATRLHSAWAQKQHLMQWLSCHLDIWTCEICGHLSTWGFILQRVKARGVWICRINQLEPHSFPCCLERSLQKGVENGFFLSAITRYSPSLPSPRRFHVPPVSAHLLFLSRTTTDCTQSSPSPGAVACTIPDCICYCARKGKGMAKLDFDLQLLRGKEESKMFLKNLVCLIIDWIICFGVRMTVTVQCCPVTKHF